MVSFTALIVPTDARAAVEVRRKYTASRYANYQGRVRHTRGLLKFYTMHSGFPSRTKKSIAKSSGNVPDATPVEQQSPAERFVVRPSTSLNNTAKVT